MQPAAPENIRRIGSALAAPGKGTH
jgi:hypothetical protein